MTGQEVIDRAVERSTLNDADLIPTTESLDYITTFERRAYLIAARTNPDFFGQEGTTSSRSDDTGTWDLTATPGDVAAVSRAEVDTISGSVTGVSVGDQVNLISIRHPDVALSPRAYLRDRTIVPYNSELSDDSSNYVSKLKVFYSELPAAVTSTSQTLTLPNEWDNLVVLPLAKIYATRDERLQEAQLIGQDYQQELALFQQHVSVYDEGVVRSQQQIAADSLAVGGIGGGEES